MGRVAAGALINTPRKWEPHGGIAQLGERGLCKPEARGSSPLTSTNASDEPLISAAFFIYGASTPTPVPPARDAWHCHDFRALHVERVALPRYFCTWRALSSWRCVYNHHDIRIDMIEVRTSSVASAHPTMRDDAKGERRRRGEEHHRSSPSLGCGITSRALSLPSGELSWSSARLTRP